MKKYLAYYRTYYEVEVVTNSAGRLVYRSREGDLFPIYSSIVKLFDTRLECLHYLYLQWQAIPPIRKLSGIDLVRTSNFGARLPYTHDYCLKHLKYHFPESFI